MPDVCLRASGRRRNRDVPRAAGPCGLAVWTTVAAQTAPARQLIIPFENSTRAAQTYWLGEASAVILTDDLHRPRGAGDYARGPPARLRSPARPRGCLPQSCDGHPARAARLAPAKWSSDPSKSKGRTSSSARGPSGSTPAAWRPRWSRAARCPRSSPCMRVSPGGWCRRRGSRRRRWSRVIRRLPRSSSTSRD